MAFAFLNIVLPTGLASACKERALLTVQQRFLLQCFALVPLGMCLATLATLNFSLALFVGLLATPLSFIGPPLYTTDEETSLSPTHRFLATGLLQLLSPPAVLHLCCWFQEADVGHVLTEAAFGWSVNNLRTQIVVWCVWWPAWLTGSILVSPA